jgi:hypothetical protein
VLLAAICSAYGQKAASAFVQPLGRDLYRRSQENAGFLLHGHELQSPPVTREKFDKAAVEGAVEWILEHTRQESWGSTNYNNVDSLSKK